MTAPPAIANVIVGFSIFIYWHSENASNEALLVCEKSRPDCERQITSRDDFSINQNESSSSFGYER
ncbi:TPA: hypothetical protein ACS54E_005039, partial [Salmonella enterica]